MGLKCVKAVYSFSNSGFLRQEGCEIHQPGTAKCGTVHPSLDFPLHRMDTYCIQVQPKQSP
jgi:hypothetical protein